GHRPRESGRRVHRSGDRAGRGQSPGEKHPVSRHVHSLDERWQGSPGGHRVHGGAERMKYRRLERLMRDMKKRSRKRALPDDASARRNKEALAETMTEWRTVLDELHIQNEELHATQRALALQHQRYQELFELAPNGYLVTDSKGVILEVNRA